jgi:hypothetical protein
MTKFSDRIYKFHFSTLSKKWILPLFCAEVLNEPGMPQKNRIA